MDELNLYDDLDDFQEEQEKKSKELQEAEDKYQQALKTIEELREENKTLKKNIQRIELGFQSLLDTARNEIKRKDKEIERLRKENDDICFRRKIPHKINERSNNQFKNQTKDETSVNGTDKHTNTKVDPEKAETLKRSRFSEHEAEHSSDHKRQRSSTDEHVGDESRSRYREHDKDNTREYNRIQSRENRDFNKPSISRSYKKSSHSPERYDKHHRSRSGEHDRYDKHNHHRDRNRSRERYNYDKPSKTYSKSPQRDRHQNDKSSKVESEKNHKTFNKDVGNHQTKDFKNKQEMPKSVSKIKEQTKNKDTNLPTIPDKNNFDLKNTNKLSQPQITGDNLNEINTEIEVKLSTTSSEAKLLCTPHKVALFNELFGESPGDNSSSNINSSTNQNSLYNNIKNILEKSSTEDLIHSATTSPGDYTDVCSSNVTTPKGNDEIIEIIISSNNTTPDLNKDVNDNQKSVKIMDRVGENRDDIDKCFIPNESLKENIKTIACVDLTEVLNDDMGNEIEYVQIPGLDLCHPIEDKDVTKQNLKDLKEKELVLEDNAKEKTETLTIADNKYLNVNNKTENELLSNKSNQNLEKSSEITDIIVRESSEINVLNLQDSNKLFSNEIKQISIDDKDINADNSSNSIYEAVNSEVSIMRHTSSSREQSKKVDEKKIATILETSIDSKKFKEDSKVISMELKDTFNQKDKTDNPTDIADNFKTSPVVNKSTINEDQNDQSNIQDSHVISEKLKDTFNDKENAQEKTDDSNDLAENFKTFSIISKSIKDQLNIEDSNVISEELKDTFNDKEKEHEEFDDSLDVVENFKTSSVLSESINDPLNHLEKESDIDESPKSSNKENLPEIKSSKEELDDHSSKREEDETKQEKLISPSKETTDNELEEKEITSEIPDDKEVHDQSVKKDEDETKQEKLMETPDNAFEDIEQQNLLDKSGNVPNEAKIDKFKLNTVQTAKDEKQTESLAVVEIQEEITEEVTDDKKIHDQSVKSDKVESNQEQLVIAPSTETPDKELEDDEQQNLLDNIENVLETDKLKLNVKYKKQIESLGAAEIQQQNTEEVTDDNEIPDKSAKRDEDETNQEQTVITPTTESVGNELEDGEQQNSLDKRKNVCEGISDNVDEKHTESFAVVELQKQVTEEVTCETSKSTTYLESKTNAKQIIDHNTMEYVSKHEQITSSQEEIDENSTAEKIKDNTEEAPTLVETDKDLLSIVSIEGSKNQTETVANEKLPIEVVQNEDLISPETLNNSTSSDDGVIETTAAENTKIVLNQDNTAEDGKQIESPDDVEFLKQNASKIAQNKETNAKKISDNLTSVTEESIKKLDSISLKESQNDRETSNQIEGAVLLEDHVIDKGNSNEIQIVQNEEEVAEKSSVNSTSINEKGINKLDSTSLKDYKKDKETSNQIEDCISFENLQQVKENSNEFKDLQEIATENISKDLDNKVIRSELLEETSENKNSVDNSLQTIENTNAEEEYTFLEENLNNDEPVDETKHTDFKNKPTLMVNNSNVEETSIKLVAQIEEYFDEMKTKAKQNNSIALNESSDQCVAEKIGKKDSNVTATESVTDLQEKPNQNSEHINQINDAEDKKESTDKRTECDVAENQEPNLCKHQEKELSNDEFITKDVLITIPTKEAALLESKRDASDSDSKEYFTINDRITKDIKADSRNESQITEEQILCSKDIKEADSLECISKFSENKNLNNKVTNVSETSKTLTFVAGDIQEAKDSSFLENEVNEEKNSIQLKKDLVEIVTEDLTNNSNEEVMPIQEIADSSEYSIEVTEEVTAPVRNLDKKINKVDALEPTSSTSRSNSIVEDSQNVVIDRKDNLNELDSYSKQKEYELLQLTDERETNKSFDINEKKKDISTEIPQLETSCSSSFIVEHKSNNEKIIKESCSKQNNETLVKEKSLNENTVKITNESSLENKADVVQIDKNNSGTLEESLKKKESQTLVLDSSKEESNLINYKSDKENVKTTISTEDIPMKCFSISTEEKSNSDSISIDLKEKSQSADSISQTTAQANQSNEAKLKDNFEKNPTNNESPKTPKICDNLVLAEAENCLLDRIQVTLQKVEEVTKQTLQHSCDKTIIATVTDSVDSKEKNTTEITHSIDKIAPECSSTIKSVFRKQIIAKSIMPHDNDLKSCDSQCSTEKTVNIFDVNEKSVDVTEEINEQSSTKEVMDKTEHETNTQQQDEPTNNSKQEATDEILHKSLLPRKETNTNNSIIQEDSTIFKTPKEVYRSPKKKNLGQVSSSSNRDLVNESRYKKVKESEFKDSQICEIDSTNIEEKSNEVPEDAVNLSTDNSIEINHYEIIESKDQPAKVLETKNVEICKTQSSTKAEGNKVEDQMNTTKEIGSSNSSRLPQKDFEQNNSVIISQQKENNVIPGPKPECSLIENKHLNVLPKVNIPVGSKLINSINTIPLRRQKTLKKDENSSKKCQPTKELDNHTELLSASIKNLPLESESNKEFDMPSSTINSAHNSQPLETDPGISSNISTTFIQQSIEQQQQLVSPLNIPTLCNPNSLLKAYITKEINMEGEIVEVVKVQMVKDPNAAQFNTLFSKESPTDSHSMSASCQNLAPIHSNVSGHHIELQQPNQLQLIPQAPRIESPLRQNLSELVPPLKIKKVPAVSSNAKKTKKKVILEKRKNDNDSLSFNQTSDNPGISTNSSQVPPLLFYQNTIAQMESLPTPMSEINPAKQTSTILVPTQGLIISPAINTTYPKANDVGSLEVCQSMINVSNSLPIQQSEFQTPLQIPPIATTTTAHSNNVEILNLSKQKGTITTPVSVSLMDNKNIQLSLPESCKKSLQDLKLLKPANQQIIQQDLKTQIHETQSTISSTQSEQLSPYALLPTLGNNSPIAGDSTKRDKLQFLIAHKLQPNPVTVIQNNGSLVSKGEFAIQQNIEEIIPLTVCQSFIKDVEISPSYKQQVQTPKKLQAMDSVTTQLNEIHKTNQTESSNNKMIVKIPLPECQNTEKDIANMAKLEVYKTNPTESANIKIADKIPLQECQNTEKDIAKLAKLEVPKHIQLQNSQSDLTANSLGINQGHKTIISSVNPISTSSFNPSTSDACHKKKKEVGNFNKDHVSTTSTVSVISTNPKTLEASQVCQNVGKELVGHNKTKEFGKLFKDNDPKTLADSLVSTNSTTPANSEVCKNVEKPVEGLSKEKLQFMISNKLQSKELIGENINKSQEKIVDISKQIKDISNTSEGPTLIKISGNSKEELDSLTKEKQRCVMQQQDLNNTPLNKPQSLSPNECPTNSKTESFNNNNPSTENAVEISKNIRNETETVTLTQQQFHTPKKPTSQSSVLHIKPKDCTENIPGTISSNLRETYSSHIVLPSISTNSPTPSNFSGIFSKKSTTEENRKKSPHCKPREYVLPAASVLCNVDNLENATKASKKLHWELLANKNEIMTEIEDDADIDTTDEELLKIKEEPIDNSSSGSPKQTSSLQNKSSPQSKFEKSSPSETDTQTENESLLRDIRLQRAGMPNQSSIPPSKIHKLKHYKHKLCKARLKGRERSSSSMSLKETTALITQMPFSIVFPKRPVGRPRKYPHGHKHIKLDTQKQHKKRGRKPKHKPKEAEETVRKCVILESKLGNIFETKSKESSAQDGAVDEMNNIENSVKILSSSVERLEICDDEPCASSESTKHQKSFDKPPLLDNNYEDDHNVSMIYHKQDSSTEHIKNEQETSIDNSIESSKVDSKQIQENLITRSDNKSDEIETEITSIENSKVVESNTNSHSIVRQELPTTSTEDQGLIASQSTENEFERCEELPSSSRIAYKKAFTLRSDSDSDRVSSSMSSEEHSHDSRKHKSFKSRKLRKPLLKKKLKSKIKNKVGAFISLEDIGIKVRPLKVHLSSFRIPKVKKDTEETIDNTWKLETYIELEKEGEKYQNEEKDKKQTDNNVDREISSNVIEKEKDDVRDNVTIQNKIDIMHPVEPKQVSEHSNSTKYQLRKAIESPNKSEEGDKESEKHKGTPTNYIINFDNKTKTGKRKLFSPNMYEGEEIADNNAETFNKQCLYLGREHELNPVEPQRKALHFPCRNTENPSSVNIEDSGEKNLTNDGTTELKKSLLVRRKSMYAERPSSPANTAEEFVTNNHNKPMRRKSMYVEKPTLQPNKTEGSKGTLNEDTKPPLAPQSAKENLKSLQCNEVKHQSSGNKEDKSNSSSEKDVKKPSAIRRKSEYIERPSSSLGEAKEIDESKSNNSNASKDKDTKKLLAGRRKSMYIERPSSALEDDKVTETSKPLRRKSMYHEKPSLEGNDMNDTESKKSSKTHGNNNVLLKSQNANEISNKTDKEVKPRNNEESRVKSMKVQEKEGVKDDHKSLKKSDKLQKPQDIEGTTNALSPQSSKDNSNSSKKGKTEQKPRDREPNQHIITKSCSKTLENTKTPLVSQSAKDSKHLKKDDKEQKLQSKEDDHVTICIESKKSLLVRRKSMYVEKSTSESEEILTNKQNKPVRRKSMYVDKAALLRNEIEENESSNASVKNEPPSDQQSASEKTIKSLKMRRKSICVEATETNKDIIEASNNLVNSSDQFNRNKDTKTPEMQQYSLRNVISNADKPQSKIPIGNSEKVNEPSKAITSFKMRRKSMYLNRNSLSNEENKKVSSESTKHRNDSENHINKHITNKDQKLLNYSELQEKSIKTMETKEESDNKLEGRKLESNSTVKSAEIKSIKMLKKSTVERISKSEGDKTNSDKSQNELKKSPDDPKMKFTAKKEKQHFSDSSNQEPIVMCRKSTHQTELRDEKKSESKLQEKHTEIKKSIYKDQQDKTTHHKELVDKSESNKSEQLRKKTTVKCLETDVQSVDNTDDLSEQPPLKKRRKSTYQTQALDHNERPKTPSVLSDKITDDLKKKSLDTESNSSEAMSKGNPIKARRKSIHQQRLLDDKEGEKLGVSSAKHMLKQEANKIKSSFDENKESKSNLSLEGNTKLTQKPIQIRRKSTYQLTVEDSSGTIINTSNNKETKGETDLSKESNLYDSDTSIVLTQEKSIKIRRKSINQLRVLDTSSDEEDNEPLIRKPTVIDNELKTPLTTSAVKNRQRRKRVVKVLSTSMESPSNSANSTLQQTSVPTSPLTSPTLNHPIFNNEVSTQSSEFVASMPMTPNQQDDNKFKEIDSKLHAIFQSPQYTVDYKISPAVDAANLALLPPPIDDTKLNVTIDETQVLNQENIQSSANVTQLSESISAACLNDSTSAHNNSEIKQLSLGTSEYRFEKVSDNVINLFISRKRKRKRSN